MSAPIRLALDGGPPCLATSYVARWPDDPGPDGLRSLEAMTGHCLGQGPTQTVRRLERRWSDATGRAHVVACRSVTAAARLAAASLEIGAGDEVICPVDAAGVSFAFTAVSQTIPVFVDLDPQTLHIDPAAVDAAITERTRAILAVDLYGATADYRALDELARRHDLVVLEDGSQSLGATFEHRPVGALGAASFCALPTDSCSAPGAGALYTTDDDQQAANARRILLVSDDFGLQQPFASFGAGMGWSYRISELDAIAADGYLGRLEHEVAVRSANGRHLRRQLSELAGIWVPDIVRGASPVYSSFPVLVQPDELGLPETAATALRDTLIDCTTAEGLWMDRSQPQPMTGATNSDELRPFEGAFIRTASPRRADYPVADAMWAAGLVLGHTRSPFNPPHSTRAMDRITDCFTKILVDNVDRLCQLTIDRMRTTP
jgi:perosamine synthetase